VINGRHDGYAENQAPMFHAWGAPADQKEHVVHESNDTPIEILNVRVRC
jgi:hypothetical protein